MPVEDVASAMSSSIPLPPIYLLLAEFFLFYLPCGKCLYLGVTTIERFDDNYNVQLCSLAPSRNASQRKIGTVIQNQIPAGIYFLLVSLTGLFPTGRPRRMP